MFNLRSFQTKGGFGSKSGGGKGGNLVNLWWNFNRQTEKNICPTHLGPLAAAKIYTGFRVKLESILYWVVLHSQNRFLGLTSKLRPMMLSIRILQSNYLSLKRDWFSFIKMKYLMPRSSNSANEEVPIATQSPIMMVHFL